jgi:hypothetical protein
MSYITLYSLEFDTPELMNEIIAAMDDIDGGGLATGCSFSYPWYEHEEDMLEISKQFPDAVFILSGIGKEFPDIWKKRFIRGQVDEIRANITFPDFPPLDA